MRFPAVVTSVLDFGLLQLMNFYLLMTKKNANKSTKDIYGITIKLLLNFSNPLKTLFNKCLKDGTYLQPLKKIKLCPLHKGIGDKSDPGCYRPIAIIPAIAKVLEHEVASRFTSFLLDTDALSHRHMHIRMVN